ncbi:spindle and centriole-associated protein 1 [Hypanus sabinus]|uniref:spindle and centriole-associated protein 1 n=1 Tax=Hypanus sabinus TaxID=79690 RepID=UPI0028C4A2A2|nr:spindle and centriole-associated protein 1 [Hypanus sabinus]
MSFVRSSRPVHRQPAGKSRKKGKLAPKKQWDSTINDLSVHRADAEELARRREARVSRNRDAAQWELRQRAAASGGQRRQRPAMAELLLEQWRLRDVLARSDRALAVLRDPFGDAPRLQTGFPNVTVAPGCDQFPAAQLIAQQGEPPTQLSLLSESVMDSQALNEASYCKEPEADNSLSAQHQAGVYPLEPKTPESLRRRPQTSPTWTPTGASGLNATAAIQRVKSRLESRAESDADASDTSPTQTTRVIHQVLHPTSRNSQNGISKGKACDASTERLENKRPESRQMNLEALQEMIEGIDKELVELDCQKEGEVTSWLPKNGRGLTGFTFSLVSLISRLTHSLKVYRIQQMQDKENHQQLLEKANNQQALIDALTSEFLTVQNKFVSLQANLQQYVIKTDEELQSLKQMLRRSPKAETNKPRQPTAHPVQQESLYSCACSKNQGNVQSSALPNDDERLLKGLNQKQPCVYYQYKGNQLENARKGHSLPEHPFGPAVLLSPPRQRNSQIGTGSQTTINLCQDSPLSSSVCKESNNPSQILKEASGVPQGETDIVRHLAAQNQVPDCLGLAQQLKIHEPISEHKNFSLTSAVTSLPCMQTGTVDDTAKHDLRKIENNIEPEDSQNSSMNNWLKHEAMLAQITELQLQNSALKAQLGQFKTGKLSEPAPQIGKIIPSTCESLQQRIAELNHQSAEARSKLLHLIEQQRQIFSESVSPAISPIPPEGTTTGTGSKTLEVLIPLPSELDFSVGSTPSPASTINRNRSVDNTSTASSIYHFNKGDGNKTPITQGTKPERLKEEGWFALSTHTT